MTRPIVNVETMQVEIQSFQAIELTTTGYAIGKPYSSITKSGDPVMSVGYIQVDNIGVFSVAVDPALIPLGSKVYIPGLGIGLCMDTGKAIKGLDMDICFQTMQQAVEWGRQKKLVFILEKGVE
jgi:3D (Asp-Asp-Asp) domain-containing protein